MPTGTRSGVGRELAGDSLFIWVTLGLLIACTARSLLLFREPFGLNSPARTPLSFILSEIELVSVDRSSCSARLELNPHLSTLGKVKRRLLDPITTKRDYRGSVWDICVPHRRGIVHLPRLYRAVYL